MVKVFKQGVCRYAWEGCTLNISRLEHQTVRGRGKGVKILSSDLPRMGYEISVPIRPPCLARLDQFEQWGA